MAIEIKDIIGALDDRYPRWIVDGLSRSPEVKAIQTALQTLSKASSGTASPLKELGDSAKKVSNSFDDVIKKNTSNTKTMSSVIQDMEKSGGSFAKSTLGVIGTMSKFSGVIGMVGTALGYVYDVMSKNSVAYVKAAQSGFLLTNSLSGTTIAADKANVAFDDFVDIMVRNSSTLAVWGKDSQDKLGGFLHDVRLSTDRVARFGFGISEINEFATDYLDIQRRQGILNRKTNFEQGIAAGDFIDNLATFSSVLGYSRKSLLDSVKKSSEDASLKLFVRSRIDSEKGLSDSFLKASTIITGIAGPEYGGKLVELMQDYVILGRAASDETQKTQEFLMINNKELYNELGIMADNVKSQRILSEDTTDIAERFGKGLAAFEKDGRKEQLILQNAAKYNSEYISMATDAGLQWSNLSDSLREENKSFADYLKEQDTTREKNLAVQRAFAALSEILTKISNVFAVTTSQIVNQFFGSIEGFATYLDKTIKPALMQFADYIMNLFTPKGREKMMDDLTEVLATAIHDGIWGRSKKKEKPVQQTTEAQQQTPSIVPSPQPTQQHTPTRKQTVGSSKYEDAARAAARKYGIDEDMFVRMMYTESSGNPMAVSKVGAMGLMQIKPKTAASLGITNLFDPQQSLEGGAKYLAQLRKRYEKMGPDQDRYALAAYNWGMDNVDRKGLSAMGKETRDYINKILPPSLPTPTPIATQQIPTPLPTSSTPQNAQMSNSDDVVSLLKQQNEYLRATNENLTNLNYKFSDNNYAMRKLTNTVKDSGAFL